MIMMKKKVRKGTKSLKVCLIIQTSKAIELKILIQAIVLIRANTRTMDMEHVLEVFVGSKKNWKMILVIPAY